MGFNRDIYEESILKFHDVSKAISSNAGTNEYVRDDFCMLYKLQEKDKIEYLQENYNYFPYELNLKLIKRSLQEYIESVCSDEHFNAFYGVPQNSEYGIMILLAQNPSQLRCLAIAARCIIQNPWLENQMSLRAA